MCEEFVLPSGKAIDFVFFDIGGALAIRNWIGVPVEVITTIGTLTSGEGLVLLEDTEWVTLLHPKRFVSGHDVKGAAKQPQRIRVFAANKAGVPIE